MNSALGSFLLDHELNKSTNRAEKFIIDCNNYGEALYLISKATPYIWGSCTTFRDICDTMVLYLNGVLISSPSHGGPILDETGPITEQVKMMCRNGMLTINSEPANEQNGGSVQFYIMQKNDQILMSGLKNHRHLQLQQHIKEEPFNAEFGPFVAKVTEAKETILCAVYSPQGNDVFDILVDISRSFN